MEPIALCVGHFQSQGRPVRVKHACIMVNIGAHKYGGNL